LESEHSISHTNSKVSSGLWMPSNLGHSSFHWVGIFEDHHCLSRYVLREMLWLLSVEVFLKQINLVVLSDALLGACNQILGSLAETELWVSVEFLCVFSDISILSVIVVLRPTYFKLFHKSGSCKLNLPPTMCFIPLLLVATLSVFTYTKDDEQS
jgi:hypothetical protein